MSILPKDERSIDDLPALKSRETEMSEPTQAEVKRRELDDEVARQLRTDIIVLKAQVEGRCGVSRAAWREATERVCAAAERSLAPATPTEPCGSYDLAETMDWVGQGLDVWKIRRPKWWKRIDGTPIPNDLTVVIAEVLTVRLREKAAAPPATQTGEVRKAAQRVRQGMTEVITEGHVSRITVDSRDVFLLCDYAEASAAPTPEPTGADEIVEACALVVEEPSKEIFLPRVEWEKIAAHRIRALKGKFTLAAQPGQKGERK
jgi:hypothetical protein